MEARRKGGVVGPTGPCWRTWHGGTAELYLKAWELSSIQTVGVERLSEACARTHTKSTCLSLFLLPISLGPRLCTTSLFSLKHFFFLFFFKSTHLSSMATYSSFCSFFVCDISSVPPHSPPTVSISTTVSFLHLIRFQNFFIIHFPPIFSFNIDWSVFSSRNQESFNVFMMLYIVDGVWIDVDNLVGGG